MSPANRIILNTLATYGRSFVTLFMGLFSSRWILAALGQTDYGLYGVVGSVIFFATFLNTVITQAISRFYAYSIGAGRNKLPEEAQEDLTKWFNTSFSIYLFLPVLLVAVGYPICAYALDHWLVIPAERLETCLWVLRLSFVATFFGMVSSSYVSMFTAYQYITELVVFNLLQSVVLFGCAYGLAYCPGDKLLCYAFMCACVHISISCAQMLRARCIFRVCRIVPRYWFCAERMRRVFTFVGMQTVGGLSWVLRGNGLSVLLNVMCGPKANAAMSVSTQLSGQVATFSGHLLNAMTPAIATAEGTGVRKDTQALAYRCCKFGGLLVLLFGIPLVMEMDYFLGLWLKTVPLYAKELCSAMIINFLIDYLTNGHQVAILANGRIVKWQTVDAIFLVLTIPVAWAFFKMGFDVPSIGYAYLTTSVMRALGRLYFGREIVGLSVRYWTNSVLIPLCCVIVLASLAAGVLQCVMSQAFLRLCLELVSAGLIVVGCSWAFVLDCEEKQYVKSMAVRVVPILGKLFS